MQLDCHSSPPSDTYRVLHVDDNPEYRELLETHLTGETDSVDVRFASGGSESLDLLRQTSVDCIVSEYELPGKDGLELLEDVREDHSTLPFILFTGNGSEEVASHAISAGVTDYIQKRGKGTVSLLANRIQEAIENYRVEEELRAIRQRYELVGELATDAFYDRDWETGEVIRSQGYSTNFGYDPEEIRSHVDWWKERIHPDDRDRVVNIEIRTLQSGEREFETTYRFRRADGSYGHVEERGIILCDDDGDPERAVGTLTDITQKIRRERELQREIERLDEFAGLLSHDLQNPLEAIRGRLELANDECNSEHLDRALETTSYMDDLIDDILTYAREGESVDDRELIDMTELAQNVWKRVDTKQASFHMQTPFSIRGDRTRVTRLIENLISNAVKHGGDDVNVEIGTMENGFYFEDDGAGIPDGIGDAIFNTGYSGEDNGTGFGLSIVKEIVEAHGWSITASSGSSSGARFEITGIDSI